MPESSFEQADEERRLRKQLEGLSREQLIELVVEEKREHRRMWEAIEENRKAIADAVALDEAVQRERSAEEAKERFAGLDDEQRKIFERIDQIAGSGVVARRAVERELANLIDKPVTKGLVNALKVRLRERRWRIVCTCGKLAAPIWQQDQKCVHGGLLKLFHRDESGQDVKHGGTTTFPRFNLASSHSSGRS